MNGACVSVFVAGDSGRVGREFVAQLRAHPRHGARFTVVGVANTRRMRLPGAGACPRRAGDWTELVAALSARALAVFADCTASAEVAALYPQLLARGIGVVTPNKLAFSGPLAAYRRLHAFSLATGAPLHYETTVGAALPVLAPLADLAARNERVVQVEAALSGTLSFLCARLSAGVALSQAVGEARELGYTEPHPASDLAGADALRKLAILLRTAGVDIEPDAIRMRPLLPPDLSAEPDAERFLLRLRKLDARCSEWAAGGALACIARYENGTAAIGLERVPTDSPFARLAPGANLIRVRTRRYRDVPLAIAGPGAGAELTAAGLLTDLIRAHQVLQRRGTNGTGAGFRFALS